MGNDDIAVKIMQGLREDMQGMRSEMKGMREDMQKTEERNAFRFGAIEPVMKDLAEQMVMLARGVRTAIEVRENIERRVDEHETRLSALEKRAH
jgi:hypothetical protein